MIDIAAPPSKDEDYAWAAQEGPQRTAIWMGEAVQELFYGGAVFGGKTSYLLGDFAQDISQGSDWRGVLFRQSYPDLEEYATLSAVTTAGRLFVYSPPA